MMSILTDLLSAYDPESPNFRPTEIYNESWLVKLIMSHASSIPTEDHPLSFLPGSSWYSEALLPTVFKAREQGDPLAESRTNADGVIGHFRIGQKAKADFELLENAKQFTVVEAKIGSPLSKGTTNAAYFDQAARNVACMTETLAQAGIKPSSLDQLDFIVLAPYYSIEKGTFSSELDPNSIQEKVKKRVDAYDGELNNWYFDHFIPTLKRINIQSLAWETALEWIGHFKPDITDQLIAFYDMCLIYK
ncbi:MAG: hypothetical protein HQ574_06475 [Chloroflexi bacterium]|nr:hypothetical protein [Chloroflexota bacterium]